MSDRLNPHEYRLFEATRERMIALISGMSDEDFARFLYCQEISATFLAAQTFERSVVHAMLACDRVTLKNKFGKDVLEAWDKLIFKKKELDKSTLGTLISILEYNDFDGSDIKYLRWIKSKRDYVVHRLFQECPFPGNLDTIGCYYMSRRIHAIQILLNRAERRFWYIFQKHGLVEVSDMGKDGILIMPKDVYSALEGDDSD